MYKKILNTCITLLLALALVLSCSSAGEVNPKSLPGLQIVNRFFETFEQGDVNRLVEFLDENVMLSFLAEKDAVPYAGTASGIDEAKDALNQFFRLVKISSIVTESIEDNGEGTFEVFARIQGMVSSSSRMIDIQHRVTFLIEPGSGILEVSLAFARASMELALTARGEGTIISDINTTEEGLALMASRIEVVKPIIGEGSYEDFRPNEVPAELPEEAILTMVTIGGIPCERIEKEGVDTSKIILEFHGGGFALETPGVYRALNYRFVEELNYPLIAVEYRLAPEYPFPAGLEDNFAVYDALLVDYSPEDIIFVGDSAGGGYVFSTALLARDRRVPQPGAIIALSPWLDLSNSGDSYEFNREADFITKKFLDNCAGWYVGDTYPNDPLISPVLADVSGLPPVYMTISTNEILMSDSITMFNKLAESDVEVFIEFATNLPHVWPRFVDTVDTEKTIKRIGEFVRGL